MLDDPVFWLTGIPKERVSKAENQYFEKLLKWIEREKETMAQRTLNRVSTQYPGTTSPRSFEAGRAPPAADP